MCANKEEWVFSKSTLTIVKLNYYVEYKVCKWNFKKVNKKRKKVKYINVMYKYIMCNIK